MPAFFINPINEEHIDLLKSLDKQNQDLRVFVSEGAYCGIFFEESNKNLREIYLNAIQNSNLQRILWISKEEPRNDILEIDNLAYIKYSDENDYFDTVLNLEEVEEVNKKFIDLK